MDLYLYVSAQTAVGLHKSNSLKKEKLWQRKKGEFNSLRHFVDAIYLSTTDIILPNVVLL